ncbi:hypothetical protein SAMN05421737_105225 [Shouchella lonarensis]|uniref:Uncharacterized protein n=1 Tax=Shouchella lonarensis TaxID=1464122 RepID=A0A1G6J1D0_9BACI|nr:hypothetical protein SAMN05421737_105225 [Shouchella lonarensis]
MGHSAPGLTKPFLLMPFLVVGALLKYMQATTFGLDV